MVCYHKKIHQRPSLSLATLLNQWPILLGLVTFRYHMHRPLDPKTINSTKNPNGMGSQRPFFHFKTSYLCLFSLIFWD